MGQLTNNRNLGRESAAATRVTVMGAMLDTVLGVVKCIVGVMFQSQALLIDGIHSFSDVASDVVVLSVMRVSRLEPDWNHPYGHQRIETLGTMALGSVLIAVGAALAWDNLSRFIAGEIQNVPQWPVLVAAAVSVLAKEWIFRFTRRIGLSIRSDLLVANAWHSRTDAFSSLVVLFSTTGALMGHVWLDTVAAVIVSLLIIHVGWRFIWDSVKELADTSLSTEDTERLQEAAEGTEGVLNVHDLRSRRMGRNVLVDVHLLVKPDITVSEGHYVGMQAVIRMKKAYPDLHDITYHIDAEHDAPNPTDPLVLPGRPEVESCLEQRFADLPYYRLNLHYLNNRIDLELFFDRDTDGIDPGLQDELKKELADQPWLGEVTVLQETR